MSAYGREAADLMSDVSIVDRVTNVDLVRGESPASTADFRPGRWTWGLLGAYLVFVVTLMLVRQTMPTPDVLLVFAGIVALMLRRVQDFLRDWVPLLLIFLAWEASRGLTRYTGIQVHSDIVIMIERAMLFGTTAPEFLQSTLRRPGYISGVDVLMTLIYFAHFIVPFLVAFTFWMTERSRFLRFVTTLFAMSLAQFAFALLVPVAPPRYAGLWGSISLPVVDVTQLVTGQFGMVVSWAYDHLGGNLVSAFPSLHAAYPVLAALFIAERSRGAAVLVGAYAMVVWFATMYTGHHYLIDAIGGGLLAVIAYCVSLIVWRRSARTAVVDSAVDSAIA